MIMEKRKVLLIAGSGGIRAEVSQAASIAYKIMQSEGLDDARERAVKYLDKLSAVLLFTPDDCSAEFELLKQLRDCGVSHRMPVVVFTTASDTASEREAYTLGAAEYIKYPFDREIVRTKLINLIDLYNCRTDLEFCSAQIMRETMQNHQNTIDFLANVIEARNLESGEHVGRVKLYTYVLATQVMRDYPELGLDERHVSLISSASALHDLGKIMISDAVLLKPGKLSPEETEYMKSHTIHGCLLLNKMKNVLFEDFYHTSYEICRSHHERADGQGYPDGLSGDEIPLSAKIVSIADCYDALTAKRAYKDAYPADVAYNMIVSGECGVFDSKILSSFVKCRAKLKQMVTMEILPGSTIINA